jgi:hypothetical protein
MADMSAEAARLARLLVEAETDDDIDIIGAIDAASPDVRREVAARQRHRINVRRHGERLHAGLE